MEEVEQSCASSDPLLSCCMCKHLVHVAVQLKCLHNCCQRCFSTAASPVGIPDVSCVTCGAITHPGSERPNRFIDGQVQRYRAIAAYRVRDMCEDNDERDKPALLGCPTCRHSLSGDWIAKHREHFMQHATKSLDKLKCLDETYPKAPVSSCPIHDVSLDTVCLTCERAKCRICLAECTQKRHEVTTVGSESCDNFVGKFITSIASIENELLQKSEVLRKPSGILRDRRAARDRQLEEMSLRKRRIVDAVEAIFEEMALATKNAYDEVEADGRAAAAIVERIEGSLTDARNYIRRLFDWNDTSEILNQQEILRERLCVLSGELDHFSGNLATTIRAVTIEVSPPDDVESVVRAWIGAPRVSAEFSSPSSLHQEQQRRFTFGGASATFKLPVRCQDVALTENGRSLLLAAWEHGLIELSSANGHELSRWKPPRRINKYDFLDDDQVRDVAALSDGRAAVSVFSVQRVVLLRRNERSKGRTSTGGAAAVAAAAVNDAWTEDCYFELPWRFEGLSAHGDVLVASSGHRLQLLSSCSTRQLRSTELKREYGVHFLAVTAHMVITGSAFKVELDDGRKDRVLDAHSLDAECGSDKRLWRHVLRSSCSDSSKQEREFICGVCADSSGGCLYAAVCRRDWSRGRVSALSLEDGSELRSVALSFNSTLLPMRLSLCYDRDDEEHGSRNSTSSDGRVQLLAVLCRDYDAWKTVTLHRSTR